MKNITQKRIVEKLVKLYPNKYITCDKIIKSDTNDKVETEMTVYISDICLFHNDTTDTLFHSTPPFNTLKGLDLYLATTVPNYKVN